MSDVFKLLGAIVFIVFMIALGPWLVIWAWNELFGKLHTIEFTFWTWAAVILMGSFFRANVNIKRRD